VRFTATVEPLIVRACWCRACRHVATGNASINLAFPREAVTLSGTLHDYASLADSGSHMHRGFCPHCGVHVTSEAEERPHLVAIRLGTLDEPDSYAPQMNIWVSQAPAWAHIDAGLPQFPGQPPAPTTR
jgi:hypothetical protein